MPAAPRRPGQAAPCSRPTVATTRDSRGTLASCPGQEPRTGYTGPASWPPGCSPRPRCGWRPASGCRRSTWTCSPPRASTGWPARARRAAWTCRSAAACQIIEILAGACLSTTFVWMQHHGVVRAVAGSANAALRAGDARAAVPRRAAGRRGPGRPAARAAPAARPGRPRAGTCSTGPRRGSPAGGYIDTLLRGRPPGGRHDRVGCARCRGRRSSVHRPPCRAEPLRHGGRDGQFAPWSSASPAIPSRPGG